MPARPLLIPVAELVGRPGALRVVSGHYDLADLVLEKTGTAADPDVAVELEISTIVDGLSVVGTVRGRWHAECRRCLAEVGGDIGVSVSEIFEDDAVESETWPIEADHIDLQPLVREAVLLALPLSPLCGGECRGPDPERFPTTGSRADPDATRDPRWAALDDLQFDDESPSPGAGV